MIRRSLRSTRTGTLFPDTTCFRSVWPPNTAWTRHCPVVVTVTFIIALRGAGVRRPPQLRLVEAQDRTGVAEHEAVALVLGLHELHLLVLDRAGRFLAIRAVLHELFHRLVLDKANELRRGGGRRESTITIDFEARGEDLYRDT